MSAFTDEYKSVDVLFNKMSPEAQTEIKARAAIISKQISLAEAMRKEKKAQAKKK